MSKNYLELQSYFAFLDPAEQQSLTKNKVIINPIKPSAYTTNTSEFQTDNETLFKNNPEY